MVDVFEEVEEQLRSARYRTLALKALPWLGVALLLVLIVVGGVWGYDSYRRSVDTKASEAYAAGIEALQAGDVAKAGNHFAAAADSNSKAYQALALIQQAGLKLRDDKTAEAVALFDKAAAADASPLITDLARLDAVYALMDGANKVEIEGRLKPLLEEGRPFRSQAREALGLSRLAAGDVKGARAEFVVLSQALDTPSGINARSQAALAIIDSGVAAQLPAVLKAAKSVPEEAIAQAAMAQAAAQAMAQQAQSPDASQAETAQ